MLLRLLSRRRFRLPKVSDLQSRRSLTGHNRSLRLALQSGRSQAPSMLNTPGCASDQRPERRSTGGRCEQML
jgi:hypothetical protein